MTEEKSNGRLDQIVDSSRRSFVKKGALASSALALGVAGSGPATAAGNVQQVDQVLVFAYDYNSTMSFQVVASLEENVVDAVLGHRVGGQSIVSDPDDYNGYVVYYRPAENAPGEFALTFTRNGTLQQNQQYQFGTDRMTFVDEANLLEVSLSTAGGDDEATTTTEGETSTTEDGTSTPEDGSDENGGGS